MKGKKRLGANWSDAYSDDTGQGWYRTINGHFCMVTTADGLWFTAFVDGRPSTAYNHLTSAKTWANKQATKKGIAGA